MTSNLGAEYIQQAFDRMAPGKEDEAYEQSRAQVLESLRQRMRPEFLNRIDEIIVFKPLNRDEILQIVRLQLQHLETVLARNGYTADISQAVYKEVAQQAYDPQYGARPLKRYIQRHITNELSKSLLANDFDKEKPIKIDVFEGKYVFYQSEGDR